MIQRELRGGRVSKRQLLTDETRGNMRWHETNTKILKARCFSNRVATQQNFKKNIFFFLWDTETPWLGKLDRSTETSMETLDNSSSSQSIFRSLPVLFLCLDKNKDSEKCYALPQRIQYPCWCAYSCDIQNIETTFICLVSSQQFYLVGSKVESLGVIR